MTMRERFRRWLCAPSKPILFHLTCNHCEHRELVDARELTVQCTAYLAKTFLACACERCRRPIAKQVTLAIGDFALQGGAKHVHLQESPVIRERDIRRFTKSMDAELAELLS